MLEIISLPIFKMNELFFLYLYPVHITAFKIELLRSIHKKILNFTYNQQHLKEPTTGFVVVRTEVLTNKKHAGKTC